MDLPRVALRNGLPRFARRAFAGDAVRMVVFGTSMSLHSRAGRRTGARYLDGAVEALRTLTGNPRVELIGHGLEGFTSAWAPYRVASDLLPLRPDAVLLEFTHNDDLSGSGARIPAALDGLLAQLWAAFPACEVGIVELAPPGAAAAGPTPAMRAYDALAEHYGFPVFDLATFTEGLVARGEANWSGGDDRTLTVDGVHHTAAAGRLLGAPFAAALAAAVAASRALPPDPPRPAPAPSPLARARRAEAWEFAWEGPWSLVTPRDGWYAERNCAAFERRVAVAEPGASVLLRLRGSGLAAWIAVTPYQLQVERDGVAIAVYNPLAAPFSWQLVDVGEDLPDGEHAYRLTVVEGSMMFGDFFFLGDLG